MSGELVAALLAAALLLFWVIGAYNRLVALRNDIGQAWTRLHEVLQQRGAGLEALVARLREPMAAEQGALDTWLATHAEAQRCAAAMSARPVHEAHAQAWVAAESALAAAAARALALLEQHAELAASEGVAEPLAAWREGQGRLPFARQFFNDAARAHNEAAALFPTRLVARAFRLSDSGLL